MVDRIRRIKREVLTMARPDLQPDYLLGSPPTTLPRIYSAPATWPPCVLKQAPCVPASVPLEQLFPFLRTLIPSFSAHASPYQRPSSPTYSKQHNPYPAVLVLLSLTVTWNITYLFVCLSPQTGKSLLGRQEFCSFCSLLYPLCLESVWHTVVR